LNDNGQLGDGTKNIGKESVSIDISGILSNKKIVSIGTGYDFSFAITDDGKVAGWGSNQNNKLGTGALSTEEINPVWVNFQANIFITQISGGLNFAVAVSNTSYLNFFI
jgi:alpha-tubulin suppressor-like RCC1 family protein